MTKQENYESVQRGFRVLVSSMSGYIGQTFTQIYGSRWWDEILDALNDQYDLPYDGEYGKLIDSLDIANCIRLIDRRWSSIFRDTLSMNCRTWARELMGVRNVVAHAGQQDLEQPMAERALDTMALLCSEIDQDGAEEIRKYYQDVRSRASDSSKAVQIVYTGLAQPASESRRGASTIGSLLEEIGTDAVQKTDLTRKVSYAGKTVVYPVYRVRLDRLYYNDQNDRIATWITKYEAENGKESLNDLNKDIYNRIIENFIYDSNPDSIHKTQKNISLVGQREPGVILADGRVVDGNRRVTCLRRIQRESVEPVYFETVIIDVDIREDKKQIKLLELAIQHGEEKKVDYDLIDYAIGTYRDIVQTELLSVDEYATSANESPAEVKKRIEIAEMISEFLSYIRLPEQYHVAREYQVYSLFQEMMAPLKKLNQDERQQLKTIAFNNTLMQAIPDQRKFIRDIKGLIKNDTYRSYFDDQMDWGKKIDELFADAEIREKKDIDKFAKENQAIAEELQVSMEQALLRSRSQHLKNKPGENVAKSIALMTEVDPRMFKKMSNDDLENLKSQLDELERIIESFQRILA